MVQRLTKFDLCILLNICKVDTALGKEIEVGQIYDGCVNSIKDFGAFIEIDGGHQGLLHISELSHQKVCVSLLW